MHDKHYINSHSVIGGTLSKEKFRNSGKIYQSDKCQVSVYLLLEMQREWEGCPVAAVLQSLLSLHIFSWIQKRVGFLLNYPISFWDFSGACAFLQSNPFPQFSQANLLPFYDITLVLKIHASQLCFSFVFFFFLVHVLSEMNPIFVFFLPLLIQQNNDSCLGRMMFGKRQFTRWGDLETAVSPT